MPTLVDHATLADPYPVYHRLRAAGAVQHDDVLQAWLVLSYAGVAAGLRDPRLASAGVPETFGLRSPAHADRSASPLGWFDRWALFSDPPRHTRLRSLIATAFLPAVLEGLDARIETEVEDRLTAMAGRTQADLITDFAGTLPATLLADMLGVPPRDVTRFLGWSAAFAEALGGGLWSGLAIARAQAAAAAMDRYLGPLAQARQGEPGLDLLSALVMAEADGQHLTPAEVLATCGMILFAGHETTANLIGNGLHLLLQHPDRLAWLRAHPEALPAAIEEMLRVDGPVQFATRIAGEDLVLSGQAIPAGARVILVLGAANRDPSQFPDPDRFDPTRPDLRHLAFGGGPHTCVGAPLARLIARHAIAGLLPRFPRLRLVAVPVTRQMSFSLRGLQRLPVLLS